MSTLRVLQQLVLVLLLGFLPHCTLYARYTEGSGIGEGTAAIGSAGADARAHSISSLPRRALKGSGNRNGTLQSSYYISWTETSLPVSSYGNERVLSDVSTRDDSAYVEVPLPFAMPILGVERFRVYASSNGGLHLGKRQACSCLCFMQPDCNFNTSYTGVIAGFLADLDPSVAQTGSKIATMTVDHDAANTLVLFRWNNFPFFSHTGDRTITKYNSFSIVLYADGRIVIGWENIFPQTPDKGYLIAGLRLPDDDGGVLSRVTLSSEQKKLGLNPWTTTLPGIYPETGAYPIATSQFKSGNSFFMCPISELVTVLATDLRIGSSSLVSTNLFAHIENNALKDATNGVYTSVSLTGGSGSRAVVTVTVAVNIVSAIVVTTSGSGYIVGDVLTIPAGFAGEASTARTITLQADDLTISSGLFKVAPLSFACLDRVRVFASLSGTTSPWLTSSTDVVECTKVSAKFSCEILTLPVVATDADSGKYNVTFGWTRSSGSSSLGLLPWKVPVTIYKGTDVSPAAACTQNMKVPSGCAKDCPNTLFIGNTTCLGFQCPQNGFFYDANPACTVSSTLTPQDICSRNLISDGTRCCFVADLDCNGICFGPAVNTQFENGASVCCLNVRGMMQDCLGICQGPARPDGCGVCNGDAPIGSQCGFAFIVSETGSPNMHQAPNLPVTVDLESQNYSLRRNITLFNPNATLATVYAGVVNSHDASVSPLLNAPVVQLTFVNGTVLPQAVNIPPTSSLNVIVHLNFETLMNGTKNFAAKHVQFSVQRAGITTQGRVDLNIDVAFSKCYLASTRSQCTNLPGCTFCYYPSGMEVIKEIPVSRRLALSTIPDYFKEFNDVVFGDGACVNTGTRSANEACRSVATYGAGEVFVESQAYAIIAGAFFLVASVPFLIKLTRRSGRIVHA